MFTSIVAGTDGSTYAAAAVRAAADLASRYGATLHLVCAYQAIDAQLAAATESASPSQEAKLMLEELGLAAERDGVTVTLHPCSGDAADALIEVARVQSADVIVVGSRGMTGVRRILGSVPNTVAHKAPCSVLVV
jgi:nucleotide-binding universal stress UspA family protein